MRQVALFPHIFVWGSCFWFCIPSASRSRSRRLLPSRTTCPHHYLSTHNLPSHYLSTHNLLTHNLLTYNLLTHNLLTHNLLTYIQLTHTQLAHIQLTHIQLAHTQLAHTHTTCTHTQLTHIQLAHTQLTHTQLTHTQLAHTHTTCSHTTYSHTTYSHTTCSHTTICSHTTYLLTHNLFTHNLSTHNLLGRRGVLRGRRGTYGTGLALVARLVFRPRWDAAAFCVAGVALCDIHLHFVAWFPGRAGTPRRFAWQAWHFVTSTFTLCGAWHLMTWIVTLRGRRGTCRRGTCQHMDRHFAWQAWHLWHWVGSGGALGSQAALGRRGVLRGRRGTLWHPPSLCVAGVALDDMDRHFAWQAWHLWHLYPYTWKRPNSLQNYIHRI